MNGCASGLMYNFSSPTKNPMSPKQSGNLDLRSAMPLIWCCGVALAGLLITSRLSCTISSFLQKAVQ